jgi:hypothetical protein
MFNNVNIQSAVRILNTSIKMDMKSHAFYTRAEIFTYITYAETASI